MEATDELIEDTPFRSSQGSGTGLNFTLNDNSASFELETLDPQKRELLEARFMGRSLPMTINTDSNISAGSSEHDSEPQTSQPEKPKPPRARKRQLSEENGPSSKTGKSPKMDPSKKISEYFPSKGTSGTNSSCSQTRLVFTSSNTAQTQTDINLERLKKLEKSTSQYEEDKELLQERVTQLEAILSNSSDKIELLTGKISKCVEVIKQLLIEKSTATKKEQREESVRNQLRLGRFSAQRQGAHFVDTWIDGFAFQELSQEQNDISVQKEEIEKQKKLLAAKKKIVSSSGSKRAGKSSPTLDSDGFTKPQAPGISMSEFLEKDEILKLRGAALKKEDLNILQLREKLERERNLHIRELKRIAAEDNSRFNDHPVLHNRYLLLHLIGKGGFSEVHKSYDLHEQRYVACKIHQLNPDWKEDKKANYIKHALREYNIHKKLDHPHIVQLYDVFEIDADSFCTVLEFVSGNDLDFLLKQNKTLPEKEARSVVVQTLTALKYLNEIRPPIIHFDLKPGNILLGSGIYSYEAKITDFGLSKIVEQEGTDGMVELTSQGAGTYWYLPPECFVIGKEPPKISSKVDVWSVGIIFFQCLYGKKPFGHNQSQASILEENVMLKATEVEFPSKPPVSNEAKNFIKRCLTYRKEDRPDVITIIEDLYLQPKKAPAVPGHSGSPGPTS
ncbi:PREDICTED: serine/threonine-protein kinase tousled-like 1 [Amphimedon queenslandica]|uniref:Protein kinase domain-containing protein n=1 Tax=Amphimedon queenslandica TaxID=400682 RepID=A0A1X7VPW6_AMPQE|nr:PREDICTED: serine/threonine-protein kinase tousled-like 1 [Amphimedon queenslandica]|eukprot:XP_019857257.1 PREDICTED: serine/threonine-protein kinase tousled-like 1 [Amphimedon queenslandica]